MDKETFYLLLPQFAQEVLLNVVGRKINKRRYGKQYWDIEREIVKRYGLTGSQLRDYQNQRLGATLKEARNTEYWSQKFERLDIDLENKNAFEELAKLPILNKQEVKNNASHILNKALNNSSIIERHTSGTTGSGLIFYETPECEHETWATWWRYRFRHGISHNTLCGYFGGRSIVPLRQEKPPYWRMNTVGRQLMFSAYHLNGLTAGAYIEEIREQKIGWLHGYPSILSLLARYLIDQSMDKLDNVRILTFGAESLTAPQVEIVKAAFPSATLAQHYGQSEGVANISQCEAGNLHVDEDFSYVEFIPMEHDLDTYRVIGSNWINPAFPLLRYDTGDVARLSPEPCTCGNPWRTVADIDGRIEDFVTTPNGMKVGRLDHIFKDMVNVVEAQIRQKSREEMEIFIVKNAQYSETDEKQLILESRKRLGDEIGIKITYIDQVPRTKSGKVRLVVSEL